MIPSGLIYLSAESSELTENVLQRYYSIQHAERNSIVRPRFVGLDLSRSRTEIRDDRFYASVCGPIGFLEGVDSKWNGEGVAIDVR